MAIAHFAFGAFLTTLILLYFLPPIQHARSIVLLGGVWAMVPDVHWVSPILESKLYQLHHTEAANLFWLHRTLDVLDNTDSRLWGAILIGAFIGVTTLSDHWDYTRRERLADGSGSPLAPLRSIRVVSYFTSSAAIVVGGIFLWFVPTIESVTGLYLGVGGALLITGLHGLTSDGAGQSRLQQVPYRRIVLGFQFIVSVGVVTVGLALLAAPLRFGVSAMSVGYFGLGALLLAQLVLVARSWSPQPE